MTVTLELLEIFEPSRKIRCSRKNQGNPVPRSFYREKAVY